MKFSIKHLFYLNYITVRKEEDKMGAELLHSLCELDQKLKIVADDENMRQHIVKLLDECISRFDSISKHLAVDIKKKIIEYYKDNKEELELFDFMRIVHVYDLQIQDKNKDYFSPNGKYYKLRLAEVLYLFTLAKYNT